MSTSRIALITGAASGIGAEIAQTLFREGCHVVIADRKEPEYLQDMSTANQQARFIPTDLSLQSDCQSLIEQVLTKSFLPGMKQHGWGRVINMGSIHSQVASLNKAGYIAAKHGLVGLTKSTALEGGPFQITANVICPAYVRTPLVEQQIAAQAESLGISAEQVESQVFLKASATGKMIEPAEVAAMVSYLCSDQAKSITGACWTVDGGWTAQ